jgi:lincosamide nucleotidyltransferase A/C/D/E
MSRTQLPIETERLVIRPLRTGEAANAVLLVGGRRVQPDAAYAYLREEFDSGFRRFAAYARDDAGRRQLAQLGFRCTDEEAGLYVCERPGVTTADVLAVLDALAGLRVWLDGGWGVDALLGEQNRPHRDLDLAVDSAQLAEVERRLSGLGFEESEDGFPGRPARVVFQDRHGHVVDLHPLAFDTAGDGWQSLPDGSRGRYPADGLRGRGWIGPLRVPCLTAALQARHHEGYVWSERDQADMTRLAALLPQPREAGPQSLAPIR